MLVGVIDSGIGGLEIVNRLSDKNKYILIMDNAFFPYGNKRKEFLIKRTIYLIDYLVKRRVDCVILGCNTLSITTLDIVRRCFDIKIYGVFEHLVKHFNKRNLFIGSRISSKYVRENYHIDSISVETLINLLERGEVYNNFLNKYKCIFKNYDNIILGCTHLLKIPKEEYIVSTIDQVEELKKVIV